jgi:hypothetical protein
MDLTAADLDAAWGLFANVRRVTVEIRNAGESFQPAQTVDALELPREVGQEPVGDGGVYVKRRRED